MFVSYLGCALLFVPMLAPPFAPDVVELKDGTRLIGEIVAAKPSTEKCGAIVAIEPTVSLRTPIGVVSVPISDVARETRRAELLPKHRALIADAGEQTRAWLTIAAWSLEHGLYPEAFDAADRASRIAPRDASVVTLNDLLTRDAVLDALSPMEHPEGDARARLLERVSGKSPSRAAFARAALERIVADELDPWLVAQLKAARPETRCGAAAMLANRTSHKSLAQLIKSSLLDEHASVRAAARDAAVTSHHPDLAAPYLKALETGEPRMRERAYPMLEMLRDPRAVPALIDVLKPKPAPIADGSGSVGFNPPHNHVFFGEQRAFVRDFDVEIAQGAVIAKPVIGVLQAGVALDVKVAGVVVVSYVERVEIVSLLHRLTGQDFGGDPLAWESWWAASGGRLPPIETSGTP